MIAHLRYVLVLLALALPSLQAQEAWSTYRGNSQRTGCTDGKPGPVKPEVLWVEKSAEHFIAAPVPVGDRLYASSLSGFNVPTIYLFDVNPQAKKRTLWTKSAPVLKLPTVSSPAVSDGKLIFGDGMHQTDGALLHCVNADTGRSLWSLTVPGELVHLEGSPTIVNGKVYLGGGAAGVICVDSNRVSLEGKELTPAEIQKLLDKKWAELVAKYEEAKRKKDEFAVPPTEDMLPKPSPLRLWAQGEKKWHVDAPVAVAGDRVIVCSAFLDKEKVGDRALFSLEAATGKIQWRTPLPFNPWGGPAIKGDLIAIGGSSIGYDVNVLKGAKGDVAVYDLQTGKQKWRKTVPGGLLASVAIAGDAVLATASDGKVRAFELASGDRRWIYEGKTPFFAPVAVAGDVVYAADLKGAIHAIGLTDGQFKWKIDLGEHPQVKSPGMIYGGPIVHGGRLYVATCNLAGTYLNGPTAVVCIGDK